MRKNKNLQKARLFHNVLTMAALGFVSSARLAVADTAATPSNEAASRGPMFTQTTGEDIYKGMCQGCHMPDGRGATGAGSYPALATDSKLSPPGYSVTLILHGHKAMPGLGPYFTDQQVADVVNYIRSHFGNKYEGRVTASDVKAMR